MKIFNKKTRVPSRDIDNEMEQDNEEENNSKRGVDNVNKLSATGSSVLSRMRSKSATPSANININNGGADESSPSSSKGLSRIRSNSSKKLSTDQSNLFKETEDSLEKLHEPHEDHTKQKVKVGDDDEEEEEEKKNVQKRRYSFGKKKSAELLSNQ